MLQRFIVLTLLIVTSSVHAIDRPWLDSSLSKEARIQSLMDAMTVEEKMSQLLATSPGIERLGILPYDWWNEALHGVARTGRATVFPQTIGLAATFDDELLFRIATAISDEARAKFNIAQSMGNYGRYAGLTFWSPNVNIFRDPRWGRGMETYGEDPYLQARMGTAFVRGMQGDNPDHMKVAACAKHYAVHSGPEELRHEFDVSVSKKDMQETYLPAFEALINEGVECVMCAYNRVDGAPACGSDVLLKDILREQWGFDGHVVSDCWAIEDFYKHHKVSENAATSAAWALKSGTDVNCGVSYEALPEALAENLIDENDIDTALRRLLNTKMKLGFFDEQTAWDDAGAELVESTAHVKLSREAAQKSVVMLKNSNNVLPLKKDMRRLYVVGPHATNSDVLYGNYNGLSSDSVSILDGIVGKVSVGTTVDYGYGQLPFSENINPMDWVTGGAKDADATIAVLGISGLLEGEEGAALASPTKGDRMDLNLPKGQLDFLRKLREGHDRPLIVVVTGGSPITMPEVEEIADAILFVWYPGQQGGNAVADVIFGDISPSGRLPITFPVSADQLPPFEDYSMEGRTYKYMTGKPLYPFGYGLSYSDFEYGDVELSSKTIEAGEPLEISVRVSNSGEVTADEVVQLYLSIDDDQSKQPISTLIDFQRLSLAPGKSGVASFTVKPDQMMAIDESGEKRFFTGKHTLHIGGVSPGPRGKELTGNAPKTASFKLRKGS
jgi:beta-glucosidase